MPSPTPPTRVGRPRAEGAPENGDAPREQILKAAAELFITHGFTATTTRAIAEAVGIRQATLYYHFAGKEEILHELLNVSLHPGIEIARRIEAAVPTELSPAAALHALATIDARTLAETKLNLAFLWLLPEVQSAQYAHFHEEGREIERVFARLGSRAQQAPAKYNLSEEQLGAVLIHISELITLLRRSGPPIDPGYVKVVGVTCLRACGLGEKAIRDAITESEAFQAETDLYLG